MLHTQLTKFADRTRVVLASQWQPTCLSRPKTRFLGPQITGSLSTQRRSNTTGQGSEILAERFKKLVSSTVGADSSTSPSTQTSDAQLESVAKAKTEEQSEPPHSERGTDATKDWVQLSDAEITESDKRSRKRRKKVKMAARAATGQGIQVPKEGANDSPLSHELRSVMRALPSAVVVLTTSSKIPQSRPTKIPKSDNPGHRYLNPAAKSFRGMTLSSFASLTLSPEPIVTFNIRSPSSSFDALVRSRKFLVHILDADPQGARIADLFTKGNGIQGVSPFIEGVRKGAFRLVSESMQYTQPRFEGVKVELPRLWGPGIKRILKCELFQRSWRSQNNEGPPPTNPAHEVQPPLKGLMRVGDHVLVLAKVLEILDGGGKRVDGEDPQPMDGYGLSYVDRAYRHAGEAIEVTEGTGAVQVPKKKNPKKVEAKKEEPKDEEFQNEESK